jgi:RND family efflux transporter MFP subunit
MSLWKQAILALAVLGIAVVMAGLFVPGAQPLLARVGLLAPLERIGLIQGAADAPAGGGGGGGGAWSGGGSGGPATVIAQEPTLREMRDTVTAIGTARGVRSVTIAAEVAGQITALNLASGTQVTAGTVLATLDTQAAAIALDRARLMLDDAQATSDRVARLARSGTATDLQKQEAALALKTAELALRDAEFELSRHSLVAPISGWVGLLGVEVGDRVTPGQEITVIEDRTSLIVEFRVPERLASRLAIGDAVSASPLSGSGAAIAGQISALDNRVDEANRSLAVQASIPNADDALRAGMALKVSLDFPGESHPAVDPLAIQWGADGAYVWVARQGKAARAAVSILQRNSDAVLVQADFQPGDLVITEGVQSLRPGAEVTIAPAFQG